MMTQTDPDLSTQTIQALRDGRAGLGLFCEMFRTCSDEFEQGHDQQGKLLLLDCLPKLDSFVRFCHALLANSRDHASTERIGQLVAVNHELEDGLGRLLVQFQAGDVLGMADVLRFDLCDTMGKYEELFPALSLDWEAAATA